MLTIICIIAIGVLIMNIKAIQKNKYIGIRIGAGLLFILSSARYISLLLFDKGPTMELIIKAQGFYYITFIGISIPLILVTWYITPLYREKIRPLVLAALCGPHTILYLAMLVVQPFEPVKSQTTGYIIEQTGSWPYYLSLFQLIFIFVYIFFALYAYKLYKHKQTRSQYLVLIMSQLLLLVDGLSYLGIGVRVIPPFTLTEIFAFLAIYYGFSITTIDARGIKR